MKNRAEPFAVLGMLGSLLFPGCQGKRPQQQSNDVFASYEIPCHPSLVHFGGERVYSQDGRELTWDGFYSDEAPSAIVSYYKQELGEHGFEARAEGGIWRFPPHDPARMLDVLPISANGPHSTYRDTIPTTVQTVVILSRR